MLKETTIKNPILPGFHPDPSILRVGDDYYIATSTFEGFPGVEVGHSQNLINGELVDRPLNRIDQLDMRGIDPSGGVGAPCLTYNEHTKKFNLVYSIVYSHLGNIRAGLRGSNADYHTVDSFVITTDKIGTPGSKRVYLNTSGFDQSFFHDDDGKTYLVNVECINENRKLIFNGIIMQEFDNDKQKLIGPIRTVYKGSPIGKSEGPHVYKKGDGYYLGCAEGGTGWNHAFTMARSKSVWGPYETAPNYPVVTSVHDKNLYLQKAGHGDGCEDKDGNVGVVSLVSRGMGVRNICPLGRETALYRYKGNSDGGLVPYDEGKSEPRKFITVPFEGKQNIYIKEHFDFTKTKKIPVNFNSSRVPFDKSGINFTNNGMKVRGRHANQSTYHKSQVMRRGQSVQFKASTIIEFDPPSKLQSAGIMHKYDEANQFVMKFTRLIDGRKIINIERGEMGVQSDPLKPFILPDDTKKVWMQTTVKGYDISFSFSLDGKEWIKIPMIFSTMVLADGHIFPGSFTGTYVGMHVTDMNQQEAIATFKEWTYEETEGDDIFERKNYDLR